MYNVRAVKVNVCSVTSYMWLFDGFYMRCLVFGISFLIDADSFRQPHQSYSDSTLHLVGSSFFHPCQSHHPVSTRFFISA